jgi:hypothetical protein
MLGRSLNLCLVVALLFASQVGCKKPSQNSPEPQAAQAHAIPKTDSVLTLHWLGLKQLQADANSGSFMKVWNLPESQKLEIQTLDKLAAQAWKAPQGTNATAMPAANPPNPLLRPLLDDLVQAECYLEVASISNQLAGSVLAIRLDEQRSSLWQTNLAAVLESLIGKSPVISSNVASGWSLQLSSHHDSQAAATNSIIFQRVKDWTLLALGPEQNPALAKLAAAIQANGIPFAPRMTNFWVEAEADLPQLSRAFAIGAPFLTNLSKINLTVMGQGASVRMVAQLKFARALNLNLEPWNVPTNLVHAPLTSFTAIRGLEPWLQSLPAFRDVAPENLPNQLFAWAQGTTPMLYFCAAPYPDASNRVYQITQFLLTKGNAWMATNGVGRFKRPKESNSAIWDTVPFLDPHLEAPTNAAEFAFLRFGPATITNRPAPLELYAQFLSRTNLLAYDWELSGPRLESWLYIAQFFRFALRKNQVPPDSVSVAWLNAMEPDLANCATQLTQSGPDELLLVRNSTIGLSSLELQVLADWFESPNFPHSLVTFAPLPPAAVHHAAKTNSLPSSPPTRITNAPAQPHP